MWFPRLLPASPPKSPPKSHSKLQPDRSDAENDRHRLDEAQGFAQPMGPAGVRGCHGRARRHGQGLSRHGRAAARPQRTGDRPRLFEPALLRAAHDAAHVRGAGGFAGVHLHLCDARGEKPARRNGADPGARHPPVGADPRIPFLHGDVFPRALPRQRAGRGMRGGFRDLHQPGLEHGLFVLPIAAHGARTISTKWRADCASRDGRDSGSSKRPSPCRA